ncbi:nucleotide-binding protein [Vibrio rotiferianus]
MDKPRLFIGSSSESYNIASACNVCLDRKVEVTIWDKIFNSGGDTLTSLIDKSKNVDFALFVFRPEDITTMRENSKPTVRDNVVFELGLFIGALGKERCFILKPRGEDLHMPTDLLGVNLNDYDPNRSDNDLESSVNAACTRFLSQIEKLGRYQSKSKDFVVNSANYVASSSLSHEIIDDYMVKVLGKLLATVTDTDSLTTYRLAEGIEQHKSNLALIKLERMRLIEKTLDSDMNGNEWFGYKITQDGVDYILDNETRLDRVMSPPTQPMSSPQRPVAQPPQPMVPPQIPDPNKPLTGLRHQLRSQRKTTQR